MTEATFDYIVVGGGSGGNVVAARLVEAGNSVLVLEAGRSDRHPFIHAPAGLFMLRDTGHATCHATVPQAHANGRVMYIPTGSVLGGGSSVNGMIYMRGEPQDYDEWRDGGATGWGWADVLPFFRKSEANQRLAGEMHGTVGPLPVSDPTYVHPLSHAFLRAAQQAGHPWNHDFNQGATRGNRHGQLGVGFYQTTTRGGQRASTSTAFLSRVRRDRKLTVWVDSPVTGLVLDGRRATGVRVKRMGGGEKIVGARAGVVLAAGTLVTPKLLMLSGIGPGGHLNEFGIKTEIDLSGVGQNLHDHLEVQISARLKGPVSLGRERAGLRGIRHGLEWLLQRSGVLTSTIVEAGGFFDTDDDGRPDIQIHVVPAFSGDVDREPPSGHGLCIDPGFLRPKSRGELRLANADPRTAPIIDPHYLEAPEDVATLVRGVRLTREFLRQPALADLVSEEVLPGTGVTSAEAVEDFVRQYAKTTYHPVGTCRMGTDKEAVVDPELKLRGAENIWIADASVMPSIVSGNTNAPTIMIGERAAEFIFRSG